MKFLETKCVRALDGRMIGDPRGQYMPERVFELNFVESEIDLKSVGSPILHLIETYRDEKVVVQPAFSHCVQYRKLSKRHFYHWT